MAISVAIRVAGGSSSGIGRSYSHMLGLTWSRLEGICAGYCRPVSLDEICICTGLTPMLIKPA